MENASKALIMAGGILITILVVSLLVLFWNQVSDYEKTSSDAEKEAQLSTFNEQFTQYARTDLRGVDLISLVNKVINYNSKNTGAGEIDYSQKITLVITIGQEFRTKYATDSSLELFKDDTYEITDNNNNLVKVINSQKELEDKYTLKALDKLSSNYEALKTYYYSTDEEERTKNGKSVEEVIGKSAGVNMNNNAEKQKFFDDIVQHREYAEFKTAKFTTVGNIEYNSNGQISKMVFKYKK